MNLGTLTFARLAGNNEGRFEHLILFLAWPFGMVGNGNGSREKGGRKKKRERAFSPIRSHPPRDGLCQFSPRFFSRLSSFSVQKSSPLRLPFAPSPPFYYILTYNRKDGSAAASSDKKRRRRTTKGAADPKLAFPSPCALDPTHVSSSLLEKKEASTSNQASGR